MFGPPGARPPVQSILKLIFTTAEKNRTVLRARLLTVRRARKVVA
jgi:hypothetical protein